jgi:hemerythrin-like domain-containing protein
MAMLLQTVTLSPAFLQEIKEDDRRLKTLLDRFRQLASNRPLIASANSQLADVATDVRDQLAFHFALEEAYGYIEDPVVVAPRLCERIEQLRIEHSELYALAARIVDSVEALSPDESESHASQSLADQCHRFLRSFDQHEAKENALIAQAFNEDIGECD